jgi:SAM-dependent methyltransferase
MSGFSPDWLALREGADHRSRNPQLANVLATRFAQRTSVTVVDLGCGTGSNLRATSQLLPAIQSWTLVDYDPALLAAARVALADWADAHTADGDMLVLTKGNAKLQVAFKQADLASDQLDACFDPVPDLVTASALFDLASAAFIKRFAATVARHRSVFYTVLTYNGIQKWTPRTPADQSMTAAFHRHQMTDKGFGVSCGPTAAVTLADQFETHGYMIEEGDSPWRLYGDEDRALVQALATGFAAAVRETKAVDAASIDQWLATPRTGSEVGHTDTLAIPGSGRMLGELTDGDD